MKPPPTITSITDVVERQLCTGCGGCAFAQPLDISMVDDLDLGRRPVVRREAGTEVDTGPALAICPGVHVSGPVPPGSASDALIKAWGPVLEVWEGYANDPEIRFAGSSGGVVSGLSLHAVERAGFGGILHTAARTDVPYLNHTVLSRSREEVLARAGSRYAPASPCDGLDQLGEVEGPSVFIGKPCDVSALAALTRSDAELERAVGLSIGIFCAGTPTTRGTLELIRKLGVDDPNDVTSVRYRGNGWPGRAVVESRDASGTMSSESASYEESWGHVLQKHRQWRCYLCADHTGESGDISVGDPWYRPVVDGEPGRSLVLVRTERGRRAVHEAVRDGYLTLERVSDATLPASQPNLLAVRGAVWGRTVTLRSMGLPAPVLERTPTFHVWLRDLPLRQKIRSIFGTARRVFRRGLYGRRRVHPFTPSTDQRDGTERSTTCAG